MKISIEILNAINRIATQLFDRLIKEPKSDNNTKEIGNCTKVLGWIESLDDSDIDDSENN